MLPAIYMVLVVSAMTMRSPSEYTDQPYNLTTRKCGTRG